MVGVKMLGFLTSFAHDRALQETVDRVNLRMKKTQLCLSPHTHPVLTEDRLHALANTRPAAFSLSTCNLSALDKEPIY